jgi:hypothetical protein
LPSVKVKITRSFFTSWDVANVALSLASAEANFITDIALLVDGGGALNVG